MAYPEFFDVNSPTKGWRTNHKNFPTVTHDFRMYSLNNSYDFQDLEDWYQRL